MQRKSNQWLQGTVIARSARGSRHITHVSGSATRALPLEVAEGTSWMIVL